MAQSEPPATEPSEDTATPDSSITRAGYWPWISLALAIGWLATLLTMLLKRHNKIPEDGKIQREDNIRQSRKEAERKLKQACTNNDAAATKEALLLWGKSIFPDKPTSSLTSLSKAIGGSTADQINTLNMALYSQSRSEWEGKVLWESIHAYNKSTSRKTNGKKEILAPMYPG